MGFLKKFKEQKQDGPDAPSESCPTSTQPSIGPEDFLPPEPVPRTTRSRAKASSAAPTQTLDVASPPKGKTAARSKAKEYQQQPAPAETMSPLSPTASPKLQKGKPTSPQMMVKAAASNKGTSNKASEDGGQMDAPGPSALAPAALDLATVSRTSGGRSRAASKVAPSPRKETRGKGTNLQVEVPKGGSSPEFAQQVDATEVQASADPSTDQPSLAVSTGLVPHAEHLSTGKTAHGELLSDEGHISPPDVTVDSVVPSRPPQIPEGSVTGQAAIILEVDLPRDPRKRHRPQTSENALLPAERSDVPAAAAKLPASSVVVVPQPEAQQQPQREAQLMMDAQAVCGGQGTAVKLETPKEESCMLAAQPGPDGHILSSSAVTVSGTAGIAAGFSATSSQAELDGRRQDVGKAELPPPPPLPFPLPPPLPPHLAGSRGQPHALSSGAYLLASRDDASARSAYVMVGLRESTAGVVTAPGEPGGAGGTGGSGADQDRNWDRDRHRQEAERTRERTDRDRLDREKERSRHQPEADIRVTGTRSSAEGRASSPGRRDMEREGGRSDNKTVIRSRSLSRDRASKPAVDVDVTKDKDRHRDKDASARSEKDRERERAREKEREKEKLREREKDRVRDREKDTKDSVRVNVSAGTNGQRNNTNDRSGNGRDKASGRSRSRSRDAKRTRAEEAKSAADVIESAALGAIATRGSAAVRSSGSNSSHRDSGTGLAPSAGGVGISDHGRDADTLVPSAGGVHRRKVMSDDTVQGLSRTSQEAAGENVSCDGRVEADKSQPCPSVPSAEAEEVVAPAGGPADSTVPTAGASGSSRCKREPIVWNPPALSAVPSPKGEKQPNSTTAEADGSNGIEKEDQDVEAARVPLSPSPRRTYSSSDSEPTRSRSRGYSSSDEDDDVASNGKRNEQAGVGNGVAAGGAVEGEFDNAENDHEEVLLEYDFDLMEADLMDEHLDEHVRAQDDAVATSAAVPDGGAAGQATGAGEPAAVEVAAAEGDRAEAKDPGSRFRNGATGRVAYEDMGAPGPDLSREQQVAHVTAGLVGQVGEDMLAKLRKLLNDMSALDLSTVRPWALRSLLAINDDEARWRASQALLSIEWSTANNPGGVLHSRLQRAVEMERIALFRSGRAARAKRGRSSSPGGVGPAAKRADRPGDAKPGRAASTEGRRRRSRSREREGGRSRGGTSKDRGRSREPRETREGRTRPKSPDVEEERRRDRHRVASKDRDQRDRERNRDRDARDPGLPRPSLREPDLKLRRWDDVMRATMRGCIVKLPRAFVEDARRVLYDIDGLDCSQIDANAWDPLLMLPNCEQRLNALRTLRNIRWKERFNVSATVKGTLLRCAEQVQRDMQRRDMMRPSIPLMPMVPPGLMPPAAGVGAMAVRRDMRYGLPLGALPGPPSVLGGRLPPPPPPVTGGTGLGMPASRYSQGPESTRLAAAPSRVRDRERDRDERSKNRGGAAGSRGRSRSKSRSPSRGRRGGGGRRSCSKSRSPVKGRSKARSKSRDRSRSPRHGSLSKSRSRSRGRRSDTRGASSSRSGSLSKSRSPADRRGTKRSRSPSQAPAEGGGNEEEADAAGASGATSRPLSAEFKDRMYKYLKSFGKLDLSGVDDKVFECLSRLPDDGARMDCLRRLSGVQWHAVSGAQETQKRLRALLERGTNELLKGPSAPAKKGFVSGSKRRTGGASGSRR